MPKEVIVVEGIRDAQAVRRAFPTADVLITHGWGLSREQLELLRTAQSRRGVIILTDPDHAGEQIRRRLDKELPGCRHAFVSRGDATGQGRVGVEKASPQAIKEAIEGVREKREWHQPLFTIQDLSEHNLSGGPAAARRRHLLGKTLKIGYANGKGFIRRLNTLGVTREEFLDALKKLED
jgi:ribonuclease M5